MHLKYMVAFPFARTEGKREITVCVLTGTRQVPVLIDIGSWQHGFYFLATYKMEINHNLKENLWGN